MKSVFIVEHGEEYEGSCIMGVYASHKAAVERALKVETFFDGGWVGSENGDYWTNGCDFVRITEWKVEK